MSNRCRSPAKDRLSLAASGLAGDRAMMGESWGTAARHQAALDASPADCSKLNSASLSVSSADENARQT